MSVPNNVCALRLVHFGVTSGLSCLLLMRNRGSFRLPHDTLFGFPFISLKIFAEALRHPNDGLHAQR